MKGGSCLKCGYSKCQRALTFHHRQPDLKKFTLDLRNIGNRGWKTVLAEAEKCDLLCMNCHAELHDEETDRSFLEYKKKEWRKPVFKECVVCGKEFKTYESVLHRRKSCSIACAAIAKRKQ